MNEPRFQHLADAFDSIISMMLAAIRARGLRSLIDLPAMIIAAIYLRRLGREFAAMIASLGEIALPAPMPPDAQAAPAQPDEAARQLLAVPQAVPAIAGAHRARQATATQPRSAGPAPPVHRTRIGQARRRPAPMRLRRAPEPRAIAGPPPTLRDPRLREHDRTR